MSLHFLSRLARRFAEAAQGPARELDPIDHPAIAAMDLRTTADLPLAPRRPVAEAPGAERAPPRQAPWSAAA
jgi:hypothetical protein